jgi:hypothetical protein
MAPVHDRRPPGLARAVGAARANAALLAADDGWRAVVLPSLGDLAADLGPGPVALRPDGRRLAVAAAGGVTEVALPDGVEDARHDGPADALCFAGDVLLAARGAVVAPIGAAAAEDPGDAAPVLALAGAASAGRAVARHRDGTISVWSAEGERLAAWPSPLPDAPGVEMSADGELVALSGSASDTPAAGVARASDGALVRHIEGARGIGPSPDGAGVAACGDWGAVWLSTVEEDDE